MLYALSIEENVTNNNRPSWFSVDKNSWSHANKPQFRQFGQLNAHLT